MHSCTCAFYKISVDSRSTCRGVGHARKRLLRRYCRIAIQRIPQFSAVLYLPLVIKSIIEISNHHWRIQDFSEEGAPNGKHEFERSRKARQAVRTHVARLKTSWGSGGRCKPPPPPQRGLGQRPRKFWKSGVFSLTKWPFLTSFNEHESCRSETMFYQSRRALPISSLRLAKHSVEMSLVNTVKLNLSRSVQWPRFRQGFSVEPRRWYIFVRLSLGAGALILRVRHRLV